MSLSIRQYALLFALLTLLTIGLFAYRAYSEFQHTSDNIQQSQRVAAQNELRHSLEQTLNQLIVNTRKLTEWEEIHQQIDNPSFFAYWYNNRLKQTTGELEKYISDLMIYDIEGKALAKLDDSSLPHQLDSIPGYISYFLFDQNHHVFTFPITSNSSLKRIGYLSIRTNLIELLKKQTNFYYISPQSLELSDEILNRTVYNLEPEHIRYHIVKTEEIRQLEQQLQNSILELAITVIIPSLLLYALLVYIFSKPINRIIQYIDALKYSPETSDRFLYSPVFEVRELKEVSQSLREYHNQLFDTHAILDEKNKALWEQAHRDSLTGAYNRRAFDDQWKNLNDLLAEHRVNVSFMLFDIDLFKSINDTYGHQVGDEVIRAIADCITRSLRKGEHLFRLGGDEFATFLIDSDANASMEVARRCLTSIADYPFENIGIPESVRVSIGISHTSGSDTESFNNLQWQADAAMYAAKRPGNADIVVYNDSLSDDSKGLLSSWLSNTVYQAIDKGTGLRLYYQPIVNFETQRISYYEALIRIHVDGEVVPPSSIFNVVEARRFEVELDRAVIRQLIEDLKAEKIPMKTGVSLNLSGPSLTNPNITEWLRDLIPFLEDYKIVIEITETALITEINRVTSHLKEMQKAGFIIALDDFGSGYSSVKYLASMPVDVVKFDITLTQCLLLDDQRQMIFRLKEMIEEAGHQLVAEGIEDLTLLNQVIDSEFHYGQGYLFGKPAEMPLPPEQLDKTHLGQSVNYEQLKLH